MASQDPLAARLQEARDLIAQGERDQALAVLYALVAIAPNHAEAWWLIAGATPHTLPRQEALKRVLEIDPTHEGARAMARRLGHFDVPTAPSGAAQEPPPEAAPPPAPAYRPLPAPDYGPPPPAPPPQEPVREREVVYVERVRRELQPFLVVNGGCTSGCLALLLTLITVIVLGFLLIGDTIGSALRSVGVLDPGQGVPAGLLPTVALTAVLAFLRANAMAIPLDLGSIMSQPDNAAVFENGMRSLWSSGGFPAETGDVVVNQMGTIIPQFSSAGWIVLVVLLGAWVVLAFLFVFLRARSNRLLHWFLSTVGLWLLAGLAVLLGNLIFRLAFAGG